MTALYLLDTDTFSLYLDERDTALIERIHSTPPEQLAVSVITAEEQLDGWQAFIKKSRSPEMMAYGYDRYARNIVSLSRLQIIGFAPSTQARLAALKATVKNVGGNDLRIAATALETGATVVTRNRRDFERVPGLTVQNWAKPENANS